MINNRQGGGGRRRGRGGNNGGGGSGGGQRGPQNNGSRIDSRARGNAAQLHEKYKNMASDAQRAGDRVSTEYYLQFADHYFRVLSEQRGRFEDQQQPRRSQNDFDEDGDEFGDEGEPMRGREQWSEGVAEPVRGDRDQGRDQGRDPGREDGRRRENGDDRGQREGSRDGPRREWRDRPERVQGEAPVGGQHRAEPIPAGESIGGRVAEVIEADRPLDPPAPRRRGRGRRDEGGEQPASSATEPNGSEAGGFEPSGFEADRLPPALTSAVAANDAGPTAAKPRRRRVRPDAADATSAAE